ncbi:hypothetical protein RAB80_015131 [Fusarium oxysporum f. sp. vasinfectum]|nr:hypothetical protein RAB80_015131 [Fusarium oxysporum f. sp. vasinfectum]KAK2925166.1 hypothetical protein FoTM2_015445 [Fusarium oxysporum f. sp. vasinfectum]
MPPKRGDSLGGILIFGTLYAVAATGIASLFPQNGDKKETKEETKQDEKSWLQRNTRVKERGYYIRQALEEFKDNENTEPRKLRKAESLPLTKQDRLQGESLLKRSESYIAYFMNRNKSKNDGGTDKDGKYQSPANSQPPNFPNLLSDTIMNCNRDPYLLGRQFQRFRQDNPDNPSEFIWTEYDLYYFTFCPLSASVQSEERYPLEWRHDALRLRSSRAQWRSLMADQHPYDDAMEEWLSSWRQPTIEKWHQDKATNEKGFWKRFWG